VADKQALPDLWLLSDARNDAMLDAALVRMPQGSAFVFRHYHLDYDVRRARFEAASSLARSRRHLVILADGYDTAAEWGADGVYGSLGLVQDAQNLLRIATAHSMSEVSAANAANVDAIMLSPVFPTRSHPDAPSLGPESFHELAALSRVPVIALGGMTPENAAVLEWPRWAAIDGLS